MRVRHRHKQLARTLGPGGFAHVMPRHAAFFVPRGPTLVVGFDNMKSRETPAPAYPYGFATLARAGHSHMGVVMTRRNDWFRHAALERFFANLAEDGFFRRFDRVVFYGASMGGYGALSFSGFCPGAEVFVFSPQTSLDPACVPFDTRYSRGFGRGDWSHPFADGAVAALSASKLRVVFDPCHEVDRAHVDRLPQGQLDRLHLRFSGHLPARHMKHMGILGQVCRAGWEGRLTPQRFARMRRDARTSGKSMARAVLNEALGRGHTRLVHSSLVQLAASRPDWQFPKLWQAVGADPDRAVGAAA